MSYPNETHLVNGIFFLLLNFFHIPETAVPDEWGYFLWTKEETSTFKKPIKCQDLGPFPEILNQWQSLIVVAGSPYR